MINLNCFLDIVFYFLDIFFYFLEVGFYFFDIAYAIPMFTAIG